MKGRKNENGMILAGDIQKELDEIQKMQTIIPYILTISTSTCGEIRTIFCC